MPSFQCFSGSESDFVNNWWVFEIKEVAVGPGVISNSRTFGRSFDVFFLNNNIIVESALLVQKGLDRIWAKGLNGDW